jgi:multiple sugar transport system ATP-binding protein
VTHDQTEAMTLGSRVAVMQHGVLQQVAKPQELYSHPANLFVAGFIGSPAMNLLDARLEAADGGPEVVLGAHRLAIPRAVLAGHPRLEQYLGRGVVLGIRPENLHDAALVHQPDPQAIINLPVELREELGSEVHVHCSTDSSSGPALGPVEDAETAEDEAAPVRRPMLVARLDPRTDIREGQSAALHVDTTALHFFDPETGESLRG